MMNRFSLDSPLKKRLLSTTLPMAASLESRYWMLLNTSLPDNRSAGSLGKTWKVYR